MNIFPAIDLIDGNAVRLIKGDYAKKTVFSESPLDVAKDFYENGSEYLHVVDLDGAKAGKTKNIETINQLVQKSGLKVEVGGGIRTAETVKKYIDMGVYRIIIGTAAITNPDFLDEMLLKYNDRIAVGVDIKDSFVAIHGWTETSKVSCDEFLDTLCKKGVSNVICTDISKDGLESGTNLSLYEHISKNFDIKLTASGGVTTIDDVIKLDDMNIYGAIIGKALYTGKIKISDAVKICSKGRCKNQ